jgi:hypothetical protein
MSQSIFADINPSTTSGNQLAAYLNDFKAALMSGLSGTARPSQLLAGGSWIDTTNDLTGFWDYKVYDGTKDILLFTINKTTGAVAISATENTLQVVKTSEDSFGPILELLKKRTANGGQTKLGDVLGEIVFSGTNDVSVKEAQTRIVSKATEDVTAAVQGSELLFYTTEKGTPNQMERLRITDQGKFGIGTNAPSEMLEVAGNVKAVKGMFSGDVSAVKGTFTDKVTGVGAEFTGTTQVTNLTVLGILNAAETHLGAITEIIDPNIIVNKGGNQADATSFTAGITVEMSDATHFKMGYDSAKASKFVAGAVGDLKEIINVDSIQLIKNKKFEESSVFVDTSDNTKILEFNVGGTTGTKTTIANSQTVNRTLTLPDETDTLSTKTYSDATAKNNAIKYALIFG